MMARAAGPTIDGPSIDASTDLVKLLGRDQARTLLRLLELPDDERLAFISSMCQQEDARALSRFH